MKTYALSSDAKDDLEAILDFVGGKSPEQALRFLDRFVLEFRRIGERPGIGHTRADLSDESLKVWSVFSYLVIYRPRMRPVEIVRIIHGARDLGVMRT